MMLEGLQFFYMLIPTSSFLSYQRIMIDERRIFLDLISLHLYDFFPQQGKKGRHDEWVHRIPSTRCNIRPRTYQVVTLSN